MGRGCLPEEDEPVKHGVWLLEACKGDVICMAPDIGAWMSSEDSLLKLLAFSSTWDEENNHAKEGLGQARTSSRLGLVGGDKTATIGPVSLSLLWAAVGLVLGQFWACLGPQLWA